MKFMKKQTTVAHRGQSRAGLATLHLGLSAVALCEGGSKGTPCHGVVKRSRIPRAGHCKTRHCLTLYPPEASYGFGIFDKS